MKERSFAGKGFSPLRFLTAGAVVLSVFVLVSPTNSQNAAKWKGTVKKEGDVTIVHNPKEPLYKGEILTLKEEMAIGGAATQEPYSLAAVRSLAVDDTGNIFVLDEKDVVIKVFDKSGKYLKSFGQKGQGPGDLSNPSRITFDQTKRLLVVRNGPLGLSIFERDGAFLKTIATEDIKASHNAVFDTQGRLYMNRIRVQDMEHRWDVLKKYDSETTMVVELKSIPIGSPYNVVAPMVAWTIDRKDNIIFGYPQKYEIEIINSQGKTTKIIQREYDPIEVGPAIKERNEKALKELRLSPKIASKIFLSKYHSAYTDFLVDADNRLFVANWKQKGRDYFYDVFDEDGRYLVEVLLPYKSILFEGGKLYTCEADSEDFPVVKRYAVTWSLK
jgi:hypothetical protein